MRSPSEHIKTLQRRVDFLKSREHQNSYDLAEIGSLEWAIVNLPPSAEKQQPAAIATGTYGGRFTYVSNTPHVVFPDGTAFYTHPQPKREWVGLTVDEMAICIDEPAWDLVLRKAEQILKEKNT